MSPNQRKSIAALIASGALITATMTDTPNKLIAGLMEEEGFSPVAEQPIPGDRLTIGHGSTYNEDGSDIQPGQTIGRKEARRLLEITVRDTYQEGIKRCTEGIPMFAHEAYAIINLAYHVGDVKVCRSTIIPKFRAGRYEEGCKAILTFDVLQGRHCSLPENRYRKDGCNGLMNRRVKQYNMCMGLS